MNDVSFLSAITSKNHTPSAFLSIRFCLCSGRLTTKGGSVCFCCTKGKMSEL